MLIYFILLIYNKISFSSSICEEGLNFCLKCNPITKLCYKCENDILIPDKKGGCEGVKKCTLENNYCLECEENGSLCKVCEYGYFPDKNGGCSYSNFCKISYKGECLICNEDFILIGEDIKLCKSLYSDDLKNCEKINLSNGFCSSCKEGYYFNIGDRKCIKTQYCQQSSFGICNKCIKNYYLDKKEDKCKEQNGNFLNCALTINGKNCDICDNDYYFNEEGRCIEINYCAKEEGTLKCEKCISGYYLTELRNSCTKEKNCHYGNKDLGICIECNPDFYLDYRDGMCKSNTEENDFIYCKEADGKCIKCTYYTNLGEDNRCSWSKNCVESNKGNCILCSENYHLTLNSKCTDLDKCIYTDFYDSCLECEDNYYYNRTSKECEIIMSDNFTNCKITSYDGEVCDRCKNNYYINKVDNLCYSNLEKNNFYKCYFTDDNGEHCDGCVEDYYLGYIDYKCSTIEGCDISENENKCSQCESEYYCLDVKSGKCEINDEIEDESKKFYFKCNRTNEEGTACEVCLDGLELKNGLCVENYHCEEKNESGNCKKCKNYVGDYYHHCLNRDFGCVETYFDFCEECNNILDFDNCTKCFEGYELNEENQCIKIKNN